MSKLRARLGVRGESTVPRSDESGQSLVELALVVTIILVMAIAVFDLSLAFYNSTLIVQGARDGARRAMDCSSSITEIEGAALATAPSGATVAVAPNPRPTCSPSNSNDAATTVTVTFTHVWITPFWAGNSVSMSETATSR